MARYATGVSVVTTVHEGVRYGMTVNSLASLSLTPTLMMFGCERDASLHEPLLAAGTWAVSVLSADQRDVASWFATRGRPGVDQFNGQTASPGGATGAPVLDGALAWFECRTWATYDGGDHTIVVGEVLDLGCGEETPGLLYFRSAYGRTVD
jgi:flavin reductase (DIM6/NTAB) family NADH-FMN oxidoreductase RutF